MTDQSDDQIANQTPAASVEPAAPAAESSSAPGTVQLSESEYNRMQAENRTLRRKQEKAEKADSDRAAKEATDAAAAAGDFQKGVDDANTRADDAEDRLKQRDVSDAVRDHISSLGLSSTKGLALLRLVDLKNVDDDISSESVEASVAVVLQQYPDLFTTPAESGDEGDPKEQRMRRQAGPSSPPDAEKSTLPPNYLSPEEYLNTPQAVRYSDAFRARVEESRPFWPNIVSANTFAIEG